MTEETSNLDRRTALRAAAFAAAAGTTAVGLAACSSASTEPSTPAPSSSAGTTPPKETVLGAAADIPVGGGKIFPEQKVVVTCPSAGTYQGFSSTCTHLGCQVAKVEAGVIACPCHGSQFNAADGSVKNGPAAKPLPPAPITVRDGQIVLSA